MLHLQDMLVPGKTCFLLDPSLSLEALPSLADMTPHDQAPSVNRDNLEDASGEGRGVEGGHNGIIQALRCKSLIYLFITYF